MAYAADARYYYHLRIRSPRRTAASQVMGEAYFDEMSIYAIYHLIRACISDTPRNAYRLAASEWWHGDDDL